MKSKKQFFSTSDVLHIFRQVTSNHYASRILTLFLVNIKNCNFCPLQCKYSTICSVLSYPILSVQPVLSCQGLRGLIVGFGLQLCAGLKHLHSLDPPYAHNDVKPGNVLLTHRKGQPPLAVLMDFGSARPAKRQIRSRSEALQLQVGRCR